MAAVAGASGARTWLQARPRTWLTPLRLRVITGLLIFAAFAVSSVGLTGSTAASAQHARPPAAR